MTAYEKLGELLFLNIFNNLYKSLMSITLPCLCWRHRPSRFETSSVLPCRSGTHPYLGGSSLYYNKLMSFHTVLKISLGCALSWCICGVSLSSCTITSQKMAWKKVESTEGSRRFLFVIHIVVLIRYNYKLKARDYINKQKSFYFIN